MGRPSNASKAAAEAVKKVSPIKTETVADVLNKSVAQGTLPKRDHENVARPARKKWQRGGKLNVPSKYLRQGYKTYWAVNNPGEIESLEERDWKKIRDDRGEPVTVDAGNGKKHYLLEIPVEYWQDDLKAQSEENDRITREITKVRERTSQYEGDYIPKGYSGEIEAADGRRSKDDAYIEAMRQRDATPDVE